MDHHDTTGVGSYTEIVESRQRAEMELRKTIRALELRSRELDWAVTVMRSTFESIDDAVLVTDADENILDFNGRFLVMWNVDRADLEEKKVRTLREVIGIRFPYLNDFLDTIESALTRSQQCSEIVELKDGRVLKFHSKILVLESQPVGRVWSFRDITERYLAEHAAHRLAAIVESSDDAIIGKDLNSIITSWNDGAERIFGYSAEEMIGQSIMKLIPAERQAEERDILSRIRRGERLEHFETVRISKKGLPLNISITVSPIKDGHGRVVGASKVARDITERKKTDAALERASVMKDEFLATLSHELRTPLNALLGWAGLLKGRGYQNEELRRGLDVIERNARVQLKIVGDLLDMSSIVSGKLNLDLKETDLPAALNESLHTIRMMAEAKSVRLQAVVDPFIGHVYGDAGRLQQVFWNLISNAIKFTPRGGRVQIFLERSGSDAEIRVVDSGEGIDPEFLPLVFDRFQQADASTNRKHGGLGLGLAIAKQLVEMQGGRISVESEGRGRGATFVVRLPLMSQGSTQRSGPASPKQEIMSLLGTTLANVRVLVVDDEADGREFVREFLEEAGAKVGLAGSAAEAMERIREEMPDVMFCDIGIPGEDGYAFIRRLRADQDEVISSLPAIALTAYVRPEDKRKALSAGFNDHLPKPVEPEDLLAALVRLIGPQTEPLPGNDFSV